MNLVKAFKLLNPDLKISSVGLNCPVYMKEGGEIDIKKTIETYYMYINKYELGRELIQLLYKGKLTCEVSNVFKEITFEGNKGDYILIENGCDWFEWRENYEGEEFEELNKEIELIYNDINDNSDNIENKEKDFIDFLVDIIHDKLSIEKVFMFDKSFPDSSKKYIKEYIDEYCFNDSVDEEIKIRNLSGFWGDYFNKAVDKILNSNLYKCIKIKEVYIFYSNSSELLKFLENGYFSPFLQH